MANNPLVTFMQGFGWTSPSDKSRHPGAPTEFDDTRQSREFEAAPTSADPVPDPNRRTIRVGRETVELDVEAVKKFVEKVKEKHSSAA
jgi:hypothetical protein